MTSESDARPTRRGVIRPRPAGFREQFVRMGWATVDLYQTGWVTIARWVEEDGGDDLRDARRAYVQAQSVRRRVAAALNAPTPAPPTLAAEIMAIADRHTAALIGRAAQ
jgi:hypothetical protein